MFRGMVFKIAVIVGLFGLIMSRRQVLDWVAPMTSMDALVVWYIAYAIFLSVLGFYVIGVHWNLRYTVALLLITWALGIVLYFPISSYSTGITGAHLTGVESATEDYVTMSCLSGMGINDSTGIITYAIIPAILILIAGIIVAPNLFSRIFKAGMGRA